MVIRASRNGRFKRQRRYKQSVMRKGSYKYLGNTRVKVEKDHGNGLVTINLLGKWVVVKRNSLK